MIPNSNVIIPHPDIIIDDNSCILLTCDINTYKWINNDGDEPDFKMHVDYDCTIIIDALEHFLYTCTIEIYDVWYLICWFNNQISIKDAISNKKQIQSRSSILIIALNEYLFNCDIDDYSRINLFVVKYKKEFK